MFALRRLTALAALLAVEVAAVVALERLGGRPPFRIPLGDLAQWARATPPADALAAAARLVALAGAAWLLLGTVAYVLARALRVPTLVRASGVIALPAVRRVVDAALAASIAAGVVLAPASAWAAGDGNSTSTSTSTSTATPTRTSTGTSNGTSSGTSSGVRDGRAAPLASLEPATTLPARPASGATTSPGPPPAPASPRPAPPIPTTIDALAPSPVGGTGQSDRVTVTPGDNLWEITATALARRSGRARADVTDTEIVPLWRATCDANRAHLRSGDPDLVFPGEVITLPPTP
jgi:hypothetical protein